MFRENKKPSTGNAIADMSQYSVESGRLSVEQQLENLNKERQILSERKLVLERKLCSYKSISPKGLYVAGKHIERRKIIEEVNEIQARLIEIKPLKQKLNDALPISTYRPQAVILEEILTMLKQIALKG